VPYRLKQTQTEAQHTASAPLAHIVWPSTV